MFLAMHSRHCLFSVDRTRPDPLTDAVLHLSLACTFTQFRKNVLNLLPNGAPLAIDALFESLDADGGGSLNIELVRKALKRFQEESTARSDRLRTCGLDLIAKFKACRRAQAEHKASITLAAAKEQEVTA
jgi:hypothetical protein